MNRKGAIINPIFIGHGSPMNAIAKNNYTNFLYSYSNTIAIPIAIIVISAHWQIKGSYITGNNNPHQIYDFYGFPSELYNVKYSPSGSKEIAQLISTEIEEIQVDVERGIDHAGWAVVKHMYPNQNIPLLELSLDILKSPEEHYLLGKKLKKLISNNILFIGSGNMVHNLGEITFDDTEKPFLWAKKADDWLKDKIQNNKIEDIVNYENCFPDYKRSIPTNEHFLPLLYILGMQSANKPLKTIYEEIQNGSISMRSIEVQ